MRFWQRLSNSAVLLSIDNVQLNPDSQVQSVTRTKQSKRKPKKPCPKSAAQPQTPIGFGTIRAFRHHDAAWELRQLGVDALGLMV